jgi:hypothetical protein
VRKRPATIRQALAESADDYNDDSLAGDLWRHLCTAMAARQRAGSYRWIMNPEWLSECISLDAILFPQYGRLWAPRPADAPVCLFGYPVEVCDDGGMPHLKLIA